MRKTIPYKTGGVLVDLSVRHSKQDLNLKLLQAV